MVELSHRDHAIRIIRTPSADEVMLAIEVHFSQSATLTSYRRVDDPEAAEQTAIDDAIALVDRVIEAAPRVPS